MCQRSIKRRNSIGQKRLKFLTVDGDCCWSHAQSVLYIDNIKFVYFFYNIQPNKKKIEVTCIDQYLNNQRKKKIWKKIYENIIFVVRKICVQKGKDQKIRGRDQWWETIFFFCFLRCMKNWFDICGSIKQKRKKNVNDIII